MKKLLKYFKVSPSAIEPTYGSERSSCFDLYACLNGVAQITAYNKDNFKDNLPVFDNSLNDDVSHVQLSPGYRALIPTGIIFDIPEWHQIQLFPRSGTSLKAGINLANCTGKIDEDYVEETFVMLQNNSNMVLTIKHGDRIAQGELVPYIQCQFRQLTERPAAKTSRSGGVGSTGTR
jgi:dUTP pyrophosphatase